LKKIEITNIEFIDSTLLCLPYTCGLRAWKVKVPFLNVSTSIRSLVPNRGSQNAVTQSPPFRFLCIDGQKEAVFFRKSAFAMHHRRTEPNWQLI